MPYHTILLDGTSRGSSHLGGKCGCDGGLDLILEGQAAFRVENERTNKRPRRLGPSEGSQQLPGLPGLELGKRHGNQTK